ncbi:MAG: protein-glutamate O-methyltransferase CheR [Bacteroidota bacterium]|nr:protein-glutamate O-methyltransferase CheR [Bacteroidota bacterium]
MEDIIRYLHDRFALNASIFDETFLERTITNRMNFSSCKSTGDYLIQLNKVPSEAVSLIDSLTNSYSEFFRNPLTFSLIKQVIFPRIFEKKDTLYNHDIRIWSAGCAAGQEAYSLAMLALDYIQEHQLTTSFRIFATDISARQIESARNGVYDLKAVYNTNQGLLNSYFTVKGQSYAISERLKKYVDFSCYDLLDKNTIAPPSSIFGGFDIIMCCNVLFYYKPDIQKDILNKLSLSLNMDGFLLTGEAEIAIVRNEQNLRQFVLPSTVFMKRA